MFFWFPFSPQQHHRPKAGSSPIISPCSVGYIINDSMFSNFCHIDPGFRHKDLVFYRNQFSLQKCLVYWRFLLKLFKVPTRTKELSLHGYLTERMCPGSGQITGKFGVTIGEINWNTQLSLPFRLISHENSSVFPKTLFKPEQY